MLIAILTMQTSMAWATQTNGQFKISVNLQGVDGPSSSVLPVKTAFCTKQFDVGLSADRVVTVVCATGAVVSVDAQGIKSFIPWVPMHGGIINYIDVDRDVLLDKRFRFSINSNIEVGAISSWSVIDRPDSEYIEMLIGW